MNQKLTFAVLALFIALNSFAEKAILYSVQFDVSSHLMQDLQKYDAAGNPVRTWNSTKKKWIYETYKESLSEKDAADICDSLASMLKRKYGYTEVEILYPSGLQVNITGGSSFQFGFPNKN
jgi:hypothetical protein